MWQSPEGGGGVRQGSRAFLLFVITPPGICRTAFGGDKKQREERTEFWSRSSSTQKPHKIVTERGANFFSVLSGSGAQPFRDLGGLWPPLSTISLCLTTDFSLQHLCNTRECSCDKYAGGKSIMHVTLIPDIEL